MDDRMNDLIAPAPTPTLARGRYCDRRAEEAGEEVVRWDWQWASLTECQELEDQLKGVYGALEATDPDRVLWPKAEWDSGRWPIPWGFGEALHDLIAQRGDLEVTGEPYQGVTRVTRKAGPTTIAGRPALRVVEYLVVTGDQDWDDGAGEVFSPLSEDGFTAVTDSRRPEAVLQVAQLIRGLRSQVIHLGQVRVQLLAERDEEAARQRAHLMAQEAGNRLAEGGSPTQRRRRRRQQSA